MSAPSEIPFAHPERFRPISLEADMEGYYAQLEYISDVILCAVMPAHRSRMFDVEGGVADLAPTVLRYAQREYDAYAELVDKSIPDQPLDEATYKTWVDIVMVMFAVWGDYAPVDTCARTVEKLGTFQGWGLPYIDESLGSGGAGQGDASQSDAGQHEVEQDEIAGAVAGGDDSGGEDTSAANAGDAHTTEHTAHGEESVADTGAVDTGTENAADTEDTSTVDAGDAADTVDTESVSETADTEGAVDTVDMEDVVGVDVSNTADDATYPGATHTKRKEYTHRARELRAGGRIEPRKRGSRTRFLTEMQLYPDHIFDDAGRDSTAMDADEAGMWLRREKRVAGVSEVLLDAASAQVQAMLCEQGHDFSTIPAKAVLNVLLYMVVDGGSVRGAGLSQDEAALYRVLQDMLGSTGGHGGGAGVSRGAAGLLQEILDNQRTQARREKERDALLRDVHAHSHTAVTIAGVTMANAYNMDVLKIGTRAQDIDLGIDRVQQFSEKLVSQDAQAVKRKEKTRRERDGRKFNKRKRSRS